MDVLQAGDAGKLPPVDPNTHTHTVWSFKVSQLKWVFPLLTEVSTQHFSSHHAPPLEPIIALTCLNLLNTLYITVNRHGWTAAVCCCLLSAHWLNAAACCMSLGVSVLSWWGEIDGDFTIWKSSLALCARELLTHDSTLQLHKEQREREREGG